MGNLSVSKCCSPKSSYEDLVRDFLKELAIRKIRTSVYVEYLVNTRDIRTADGNMVFNELFFHNLHQKFLISPNHENASKKLFHNGFFKQWVNSQKEFLLSLIYLTTSEGDLIDFDANMIKLIKFLYKENNIQELTVPLKVIYDSVLIYGNLVSAFCIDIISDDSESITEFEDYMGRIYNPKNVAEAVDAMFVGMQDGDRLILFKKFLKKHGDLIRSDEHFRNSVFTNYHNKQALEDYRIRELKNAETKKISLRLADSQKTKGSINNK